MAGEAAAALSRRFAEQRRLGPGQALGDGFELAPAGAAAVLLDRRRDAALERFLERCGKKLRKARDEATQAMVLALLVSDACGRSGVHATDLLQRHALLAEEQRGETGELLLGNLLGDRLPGAQRRGRHPPSGAALAPHRALLFKAIADWLGLFECTLEQAASQAEPTLPGATWNVVAVGPMQCVVDVFFDPGALYEEHSAKAQDYLRMLASRECFRVGGAGRAEAPPVPPSSRKELPGQMPRPPWHAEPWELDIRRGDRIGRGGFGEVFHGCWAGVHVAVKEIKDATPTDADVVDFILEIALLSQLNHPNIVRFWRGSIEMHSGSRGLLMVTEYVKTGGLSRLLHGHGGPALPEPLTLPQALSFGLDIARGVQYLHSQRVLHLDLKSPNVLCAAPWTAKLCDFGLAKIRGEHTVVQSTLQGVSPVWAPPEMLDERVGGLTEKADVYSFAIIFFELLTKQIPFQDVSQAQLPLLKASGRLPQLPEDVPEDCSALVRQCCAAQPGGRPSMSGVAARLREVAQARGLELAEVRPPACLRAEEGPERRAREAEEAASRRLAELGGQRAGLRAEWEELQRRLAEARRRTAELTARGGGGAAASVAPHGDEDEAALCGALVQEVAGARFRCSLCCKLFRGADFARRHVAAKHRAELSSGLAAPEDGRPGQGPGPSAEGSPLARGGPSPRPGAPAGLVTGRFSQALQDAADRGDAAQVATLLSQRSDPAQQDDGGTGPLCLAARSGHLEIANLLMVAAGHGHGLVLQATGSGLTPLHVAAGEGHCALVGALLAARACAEAACARGKPPLLHAGEGGHSAACALLVGSRAEVRCRTPEGETLLHVASRCGDAGLIAQAVAWRADLLAQDRDGWTPLHEAAHWGAAAVEALCRAAADVRARSRDGETALHAALAGYEQAAACEALLRWRADPLAPDVDGEGPLHAAARKGNAEACRALLARGAGAGARNRAGQTPLDLALDESVRALLLDHAAAG